MVEKEEWLLLDTRKRSIQEILLKHGIEPRIAQSRAQVGLHNFDPDEVLAIFAKVHRYGQNLKTFDFDIVGPLRSGIFGLLGSLDFKTYTWLKPSLELIKDAARNGLALCVNESGEWSLRQNGYFALSHVWIEGIQADAHNRGMLLGNVQQIFRRIAATGAKWIWLDCLAIPGSSRTLTLEEEQLKIELINNLPQIYKGADAIIILDALVMQMQSVDFVDVAVALLCGKWMTRVWTYQEIYLSRKALIMTGTGFVDYLTMCARLRSLSGLDDENTDFFLSMTEDALRAVHATEKNNAKYESLYLALTRLVGRDGKKPSLTQIALSCRDRRTGNDIDYARAFFPVLGLKWTSNLTREEGMELIYDSQLWSAERMILMHGSPRCGFRPGWAPSYLTGLGGGPIKLDDPLGDIVYQKRGLKRDWYTYKVKKSQQIPMKRGLVLEISNDEENGKCVVLIDDKERAESIEGFQKAIDNGCAYMLLNEELTDISRNRLAYCAILVERNTEISDRNEAWVYMTLEAAPLEKPLHARALSWLLLHESPISNYDRSGKDFSTLARLLSDEVALHEGRNSLHEAAEAGDEALLKRLILESNASITSQDARGWTPLHAAAFKGKAGIIRILAENGAPLDMQDTSERSPLMLAAGEGHIEAVTQLIKLGADVNLSTQMTYSPLNQAIMGGHTSVVEALLVAGANPNHLHGKMFAPLMVASNHSIEIFDLLIRAGADTSADLVGGATCIHFASRAGNTAVVKRLLQLGISVDETEGNRPDGYTALCRAVEERQGSTVSVLLQHGANPNHMLQTTWTPVLFAAKSGDYQIMRMLIEHGADASATCKPQGWTALHIASDAGHRLIVRLLLGAGWDVKAQDSSGRTPLQLAASAGHTSVVETLKRSGGG